MVLLEELVTELGGARRALQGTGSCLFWLGAEDFTQEMEAEDEETRLAAGQAGSSTGP